MSKDIEVVSAIRHRINYDGDNIYIVISDEAKEIFISSVNDQIPKVAAIYDSLTRMITLAWQTNSTDYIIKQLLRASRSKFDLPGIIASLLKQGE